MFHTSSEMTHKMANKIERDIVTPTQIKLDIKHLHSIRSQRFSLSKKSKSSKRPFVLAIIGACILGILIGVAILLAEKLKQNENIPNTTTTIYSALAVIASTIPTTTTTGFMTTMTIVSTSITSITTDTSTTSTTSDTSTSTTSTTSDTSTTSTTSDTSTSSTSTTSDTSTSTTSTTSDTSTTSTTSDTSTSSTSKTSDTSTSSTSTTSDTSTSTTSTTSDTSTTSTTSDTSTSSTSTTSDTSTTSTTSDTSTSTSSTTTTTAIQLVVSLNQPTICSNASWNPNGITLANVSTVGTYPYALFVDVNNAVYVAETSLNRVQVWPQGSNIPTRTISGGLNAPHAVCVTINGNIYVDNGYNGKVYMWTLNATSGVTVMNVPGRCIGLYVDINNTLYCSMDSNQRVIAMRLNGSITTPVTVAGTGSAGSGATQFTYPNGIVVDLNLTLYVADWGNNRIQRFWRGQLSATTVAGTGAAGTITLNGPTGVMVDANGYLYIADYANGRIVGQGPYGFRCIVGCSGSTGSSSTQLSGPQNLGFDTFGNIYVADSNNNRIQMFILTNNSCTAYG